MALSGWSRETIAASYLSGRGLEIGALHMPLAVPSGAHVTYVDRLTVPALREHYPELADREFVPVDLVTDGERLDDVDDCTQDFVIANHVLEHMQNPIGALLNMCRVLKAGGVLYLAIPDKRWSFDVDRPVTPFSHLLRDFRDGPDQSRRQHYEEWTRVANKVANEADARRQIDENLRRGYSIHFHVWTQAELLEFLVEMRRLLNFEVELFAPHEGEVIIVLRRNHGPLLLQPIEQFAAGDKNELGRMLDQSLRPEPWSIDDVAVSDDSVEIAGWALAPRGQHERVAFTVNGRRFTDIEYPIARPDIARVFWYKPGADRAGFRCRLSISRDDLFARGPAVFQFVDRALGKPIRQEHTLWYPDDRGELSGLPAHDVLNACTTSQKLDKTLRRVFGRGFSEFAVDSPELVVAISAVDGLAPEEQVRWLEKQRARLEPGGVLLVSTLGTASACREPWTLADWQAWLSTGVRFESGPDGPRTFLTEAHVRREWSALLEILDVVPAYVDNHRDLVVLRRPH